MWPSGDVGYIRGFPRWMSMDIAAGIGLYPLAITESTTRRVYKRGETKLRSSR